MVGDRAFELIDQGVPFRGLRGPDPLGRREARACAALLELGQVGAVSATDFRLTLDYLPSRPRDLWLRYGMKAGVEKAGLHSGSVVTIADAERLGYQPALLDLVRVGQPWPALESMPRWLLDYYRRVAARHGAAGLTDNPRYELSTIHHAKGREWDEVELSLDWGKRPLRALYDGERAGESRVLYVGLTRTRGEANFVDGWKRKDRKSTRLNSSHRL